MDPAKPYGQPATRPPAGLAGDDPQLTVVEHVDMKAAVASVLCLVAMLFVILLSAGGNDTVFLFGVLATGLASAAFAVWAVVGGLASRKPSENRQFGVLIGLVILGVFAFVVFALIAAFGDSFE